MNEKSIRKSSIKVKTLEQPLWYSVALAHSLIAYSARKDEKFARKFRKLINKLPEVSSDEAPSIQYKSLDILAPSNNSIALRRAEWLTERLVENSLPGSKEAKHILTSWAGDRPLETPKQIVIGVTVGVIPGVTLGRLVKTVSMGIILNRNLAGKIDYKMINKINQTSHGVLLGALEMSQGNIRKLEPDLADWFFGERNLRFYQASNRKIKNIKEELKSLGAIYSEVEKEGKAAVLAFSPAVNSYQAEVYWELERLKS
jgi:hypothetical protein